PTSRGISKRWDLARRTGDARRAAAQPCPARPIRRGQTAVRSLSRTLRMSMRAQIDWRLWAVVLAVVTLVGTVPGLASTTPPMKRPMHDVQANLEKRAGCGWPVSEAV